LRRQLAELSTEPRQSPVFAHLRDTLAGGRWLYGCAALVIAACGAFTYGRLQSAAPAILAEASVVFLLPRADLTPGMTGPVTVDDICGAGRYGRTRPAPASLHAAVFGSYGADYERAAEYELDYLITPELGGLQDARNLWPQPYSHTPWNAYVKDELEQLFHRKVCDGEMELTTAQHEIASDWISAYKRYFEADAPLRDYARSPLTALDSELLISELEEFGLAAPPRAGGPVLIEMLQAARRDAGRPTEPGQAGWPTPIIR
jgi:hypothetical protein